MNKTIHSIQINVFEKDEKQIPNIQSCFHHLLPLDFIKEKIQINHEKLEGFNHKIIHSLTLKTTKNKHNKMLLDSLFLSLSTQDIAILIHEIESRLNDEGFLYLRLEKKSLMENQFRLVNHGNCFHIKIKIAGFPANRENFIITSTTMLQEYLSKFERKKKEEN